jgi:uncharacterized protein with GYD domain
MKIALRYCQKVIEVYDHAVFQARHWISGVKETLMSLYMIQAAYSQDALRAMLQNPQDRTSALRAPIESLGGKVLNLFMSFGDYDAVLLIDMPTTVAAAAIAIAIGAGGACKSIKTTPLITVAEGIEALKQAVSSGYHSVLASAKAAS